MSNKEMYEELMARMKKLQNTDKYSELYSNTENDSKATNSFWLHMKRIEDYINADEETRQHIFLLETDFYVSMKHIKSYLDTNGWK